MEGVREQVQYGEKWSFIPCEFALDPRQVQILWEYTCHTSKITNGQGIQDLDVTYSNMDWDGCLVTHQLKQGWRRKE